MLYVENLVLQTYENSGAGTLTHVVSLVCFSLAASSYTAYGPVFRTLTHYVSSSNLLTIHSLCYIAKIYVISVFR